MNRKNFDTPRTDSQPDYGREVGEDKYQENLKKQRKATEDTDFGPPTPPPPQEQPRMF